METSSHCTVWRSRTPLDLVWISLLGLGVLLVQGYHPWAEDGGLYVAGVEYALNPTLFPHGRAFVTEPLGYSLFAPIVAALVRLSHLSLATVLLAIYVFTTALTLLAALQLARRCFGSSAAHWTAVALLGAWWTLPVAGTSLLLMDPYVTARSFSTPLSLWAIYAALRPWRPRDLQKLRPEHQLRPEDQRALPPAILCGMALVLAGIFHPLMAGYALGFVILLRMAIAQRPLWTWVALSAALLLAAGTLQVLATPEAPAEIAAAYSRYYWFLSEWQWYEWLGLLGPVAIFAATLRWGRSWLSVEGCAACRASLALAFLSAVTAILFAQQHLRAHPVARLQPLRCFLLLYAVMILLCGGAMVQLAIALSPVAKYPGVRLGIRAVPALFVAAMAIAMFFVQRASFPGSLHLELPGRTNRNPWGQAFLWARDHTPPQALFALDARYINTAGEDAQGFRAIAQRSAIPDFSKDGGEAAIAPRLAPEWQRSAQATQRLSELSDAVRDARLAPFHVQWVILHADAPTSAPCAFENSAVKVCRVPPSP